MNFFPAYFQFSMSISSSSIPQKRLMLSHDSLAVMRGLDPLGSGFIRRSDMLRALSELGKNMR